jgi:hypothetical protein
LNPEPEVIKSNRPTFNSNAMNGYVSWPSMGFRQSEYEHLRLNQKSYAEDLKIESISAIRSRFSDIGSSLIDSLDPYQHDLELLEDIMGDFMEKTEATIWADIDFLVNAITRPNGERDLFYGLHEHPEKSVRARVKNLWGLYGSSGDVFLDLTQASPALKANVKRLVGALLGKSSIKVETIDDISKRYRAEVSKADPEDIQAINDKNNGEAAEAGVPFKIFTTVS